MRTEFFPRALRSALLLSALLIPACTKHPFVPPAQGGGGGGSPPTVSWSRDVWPILVPNCQVCHTGSGAGAVAVPNMLMTDAPTLYGEWVRVVSNCDSALMRVTPSDSSFSLVFLMVSGAATLCGTTMPPSGNLISSQDQTTIQQWIDQGANNN